MDVTVETVVMDVIDEVAVILQTMTDEMTVRDSCDS